MNTQFLLFAVSFGFLCATLFLVGLVWRRLNQITQQAREIQQKLDKLK